MHNGQDYTFCIKNTVRLVVSEVWQLICEKHVHDRIISLKRDVWIHNTCLAPPLFIYVYVPRQESEWSSICLQGVSIFLWFLYWILRFFRQCSIFFGFYFYRYNWFIYIRTSWLWTINEILNRETIQLSCLFKPLSF